MGKFASTIGKIAVGLSFGFGVGLATYISGVVYGAAGTVTAYRNDAGGDFEAAINDQAETIRHLGEMSLDK